MNIMKIENTEQAFDAINSINRCAESKRRHEKFLDYAVNNYCGEFVDGLEDAAQAKADKAEDKALDEIGELTAYIQKCEPDEAESILAVIFRIY